MECDRPVIDGLLNNHDQPRVVLALMPQQIDARTADDDWTGCSSSTTRRKLQNRLHQRKHRERQRLRKHQKAGNMPDDAVRCKNPLTVSKALGMFPDVMPGLDPGGVGAPNGCLSLGREPMWHPTNSDHAPCNSSCKLDYIKSYTSFELTQEQTNKVISHLRNCSSRKPVVNSPRSDLLLTLIHFNVFRALVQNTHAMGFSFSWLTCDAISPYLSSTALFKQAPPQLQPTELQRTVDHHPWIDLFPFPAMRENILRKGDEYDDGPLCYDLVETCNAPTEESGLVVWGEPWEPTSWEVTEDFAKKWPWMLEGCEELLLATNHWRDLRGEESLRFESCRS